MHITIQKQLNRFSYYVWLLCNHIRAYSKIVLSKFLQSVILYQCDVSWLLRLVKWMILDGHAFWMAKAIHESLPYWRSHTYFKESLHFIIYLQYTNLHYYWWVPALLILFQHLLQRISAIFCIVTVYFITLPCVTLKAYSYTLLWEPQVLHYFVGVSSLLTLPCIYSKDSVQLSLC